MAEQRAVVVTGASTGIGLSIAKLFTARGWQVFGSVRKAADGERVRAELGERFTPLQFDVTDADAIDRAASLVHERLAGRTLGGLVNNAGFAVGGPLQHLPLEKMRFQLEVNLLGPMKVAQAFAPLLGADRTRAGQPGRIVQISSTAGRFGVPFLGAYVASKHALEGMSESLRRELMLFGIDVIVVAPGAILTPIWDKAEESRITEYQGTPYGPLITAFEQEFIRRGRKGLPPERVAEAVWQALTARKPRVRYEVIPNRLREWVLPALLPTRLVDRMMAKGIGLLPPKTMKLGAPRA